MELSAATLEAVLDAVTGELAESPAEVVELVRRRQPSYSATLYSAWAMEGAALNDGIRFELDTQRARTERYRALAARLAVAAPSAVPLKGLAIADLYPDGLVRYMNDLDYWVGDLEQLWRMVRLLVDDDWELVAASFHQAGGRLHTTLSMHRPHEDPWVLPYGVELSTFPIMGDLAGYPTRLTLPPAAAGAARHLLLLLAERFEQPYRARDLVDTALLLEAMGAGPPPRPPATSGQAAPRGAPVLDGLARAVAALGLRPEWNELLGLLARSPLPVPAAAPAPLAGVLGDRLARRARAAGRLLPPLAGGARYLQHRMVQNRLRRWEARAWERVQHRLPARRAVEAGMLLFGLPIELDRPLRPSAADGMELRDRDGRTFALTPIGTFLVLPGDEVMESALPPEARVAVDGAAGEVAR